MMPVTCPKRSGKNAFRRSGLPVLSGNSMMGATRGRHPQWSGSRHDRTRPIISNDITTPDASYQRGSRQSKPDAVLNVDIFSSPRFAKLLALIGGHEPFSGAARVPNGFTESRSVNPPRMADPVGTVTRKRRTAFVSSAGAAHRSGYLLPQSYGNGCLSVHDHSDGFSK